ncbi:RnfH family protein [Psychrobacter sp. JB385]|uniref:RnfH family protein n=1 Tax=Psychrobacter sp. JB385 TaxID=1434841 RepID=UPI000B354238|nr:RnfH family protein [Psychrobacter sp. JB385]
MAGGDTFGRAIGAFVGANRLGNAVVELTVDSGKKDSHEATIVSEQPIVITVYLAYAEDAQRQHYLTLPVNEGSSLYDALEQAGWLAKFPKLASWCQEVIDNTTPTAKRWHVGVYAKKQPLSYILQPLDRIEVYRSLSADPMSQRKSKSRG